LRRTASIRIALKYESLMSQHVYIRLAGHHLLVMPQAPFRIQRTEGEPTALDVEYFATEEPRFARLIPHEGGYQSKVDQHTTSLNDVLDVASGPPLTDWEIQTSVFCCAWPLGYALCSTNFPADPGPFDLVGPNGELIFVQSPAHAPALDQMVAPGQQIVRIEHGQWVELSYAHDGETWLQRHQIMRLLNRPFVITMQAPHEHAKTTIDATLQIAATLRMAEDS
jgi:hypothetical protein